MDTERYSEMSAHIRWTSRCHIPADGGI